MRDTNEHWRVEEREVEASRAAGRVPSIACGLYGEDGPFPWRRGIAVIVNMRMTCESRPQLRCRIDDI